MATEIEFSITDNSEAVKEAAQEAIERALEAVGLQVEGYAKLLAPVDTGNLRNSISHALGASGDNTVYVGTNVEYAPYQEFGTSRNRPQPYLRPAVQDHLDEYKRMIQEFLKG